LLAVTASLAWANPTDPLTRLKSVAMANDKACELGWSIHHATRENLSGEWLGWSAGGILGQTLLTSRPELFAGFIGIATNCPNAVKAEGGWGAGYTID
jgi:hypothetical protein